MRSKKTRNQNIMKSPEVLNRTGISSLEKVGNSSINRYLETHKDNHLNSLSKKNIKQKPSVLNLFPSIGMADNNTVY